MPEVEFRVGAKLNMLSQDELAQTLSHYMEPQGTSLRAVTGMRLPILIKTGSNPFSMGGDTGTLVQGPDSGYVWSLRHLVIEGLTTGASQDVINILSRNRLIWQLTGNQPCQTWGRGEIIIRAGETLAYTSQGTFTSVAQIVAHGFAQQVPEEMEGRFYL